MNIILITNINVTLKVTILTMIMIKATITVIIPIISLLITIGVGGDGHDQQHRLQVLRAPLRRRAPAHRQAEGAGEHATIYTHTYTCIHIYT